MHIFLYGPPGSGKSTIGRILAFRLGLPFVDLDAVIETSANCSIYELFANEGEAGFRARESEALTQTIANASSVIALGGGALLNSANRAHAEAAGDILCFEADAAILEARVSRAPGLRPLLTTTNADGHISQTIQSKPIAQLLKERATHYASFSRRVRVSDCPPEVTADTAQAVLGRYRVQE